MRLRHLFETLVFSACALSGQALITTVAGNGSCAYSGDGGPATQAVLCNPQITAVDGVGNIYFSDTGNSVIRKITPAGVISTIAGTGVRGTTGDGGPALSAKLGFVYQIAYDGTDNLCFGDTLAYKIRCVSLSTGIIQGYGTGTPTSAGDGGPFTSASFYDPQGITFVQRYQPPAVFADMYIADWAVNRVRKVDGATGIISTVAGTGLSGPLGDGGPGTSATLQGPESLTYYNGSLYIVDMQNYRIRQLNLSSGIINTVAGNGVPYFAGDGGPATSAQISPNYVTFDPIGNMYLTDAGSRIRKVDTSGIITTYAGNGSYGIGPDNVPPAQTWFDGLSGVYWNAPANQLLISEGINKIRQVIYQPSTTTLTATPNPVAPGGQVTLTAAISPAAATGTVNFYLGTTLLGSSPISAGQAIFNWTASGSNPALGAIYQGDASYAPSFSSTIGVTVQRAATTTSLASTPNPSTPGQAVMLTATVTPAAATGTVQFYGAGALLGSATVTNGIATFSTSFTSSGPVTLSATYSGDSNNATSTSSNLTQTVMASTTTGVASTQNPSPVGGPVTFIATVSPATSTGSVQFLDGATVLGTGTLANGSASFATSSLTQGAHSITAVYGGDAGDTGSTSAVLSQGVKLITGLSLVSSLNPSVVGQTVTFTVNVNPAATGTVQFLDGPTVLSTVTITTGVAAYSTSSLAQGNHGISVIYSGDANYLSAGSAAMTQTVNAKASTVTTVTSTQNPSPVAGPVTFMATVSPATATGTVQFLDGTTVLGTGTLASGSASFATSSLTQGTHSITAVYGGDSADTGSTSSALSQGVKLISGLTLVSSLNPSVVGQTVTFTVNVNPAATGTVQFLDGSTALSTITITTGVAAYSTSSLAQGNHHGISVIYSGDANYLSAGSAAMTQTVNAKASTITTVTSTQNPSPVVGPVTFIATVSPATATGTVQFLDGATVVGTGTLASGSASFAISSLTQGTHSITAVYGGDSADTGSTSSVLSQVVKLISGLTLVSSLNPSVIGQTVTFTVNVNPAATGTVQFLDGSTALSTITITTGVAAYSTSSLAQGNHGISVIYSGDTNYLSAGSAAMTQTVNVKSATVTTVTSTQNPAFVGGSVTFIATVSPATVTGTVQFLDGATVLGTGTLANGSASFSTSTLAQGTHAITAVYSGDAADVGSTSLALAQAMKSSAGMTVGITPSPAVVGQTVRITANMTASATGTVQFTDGSTVLATIQVASGSAAYSTSSLARGSHMIGVAYSGDANYMSASTSFNETVLVASTVALSSNLNPSTVGQSVTFTALVTPASATGTVQFLNNGSVIGTVSLVSGSAVLATSSLTQGTHSIIAAYSGDGADAPASSGTLSQTVNLAVPGAPSNLAATASGSSQINLTWTASPTSGVTYDVYASTTSGFTPSAANRIASGISATSDSVTGLNASTTYYFRVTATNAGGESTPTSQASATTASVGLACHVNYSVSSQWNNGFTGAVTIQNTGTTAIKSWTLTWAWPGNQVMTESWNANYTQSGKNVTLTSESYNGQISAGGTLSGVGFNGSYSGSNPAPSVFYLNGTLCH